MLSARFGRAVADKEMPAPRNASLGIPERRLTATAWWPIVVSMEQRRMALGVAIGAGAGVAVGIATGSLVFWLALGAGVGVGIAALLGRPR